MRHILFDLDGTLGEPNFPVPHLYEGAFALLKDWHRIHTLTLVTWGIEYRQNWKIDYYGIRQFFSRIDVMNSGADKRAAIEAQVRMFSHLCDPRDVIIVGDRADLEIRFGNQLGLGCQTVRVKQGKYWDKEPEQPSDVPLHTIEHIRELRALEARLPKPRRSEV